MKDRDVDNIIENTDCDRKERLRAQLHERLGLPQQQEPQIKSRRAFKLRVAFGVVGICAVCVAIVLPISLRNNTPLAPSQDRYSYAASQFDHDDLGLTLKEYAANTNKNILFLDWYDFADDCITTKYFLSDKKDDIIYIAEDIINGETGDHVWLAVVDNHIEVDKLNDIKDSCTSNYELQNTNIQWVTNITASCAYFEYNGYKYYVQLSEPMSDQAILDIVKEMF